MRHNTCACLTTTQTELVSQGLDRLTKREFLAAHECFEDAFREAVLQARLLLHAFAQLAASDHQLSLGRGRAAVRTWHKAREKLARLGVLSPHFDAQMDALHARLGLTAEGPRFFDAARLDAVEVPVPDLFANPDTTA
jgi:hypothetical protein